MMRLRTPGGRISAAISPRNAVVSGVVGAGLAILVLPTLSPGASFITRRMTGNFHGVIAPTTPSGVRCPRIFPYSVSRIRSEEHTSELHSLMRISYAVFCWQKKNTNSSHKYILQDTHPTPIITLTQT